MPTAAASALPLASGHGLAADTRFLVPPPAPAAVSQIVQLFGAGDRRDAALVAKMVATPQAVWFADGTPAQVKRRVRATLALAAYERAVPVLVAYNIPGRDCSQYSAGGAHDQAAYKAWIDGLAAGIGNAKAVVLVEPDALGNMPSNCKLPFSAYPFTDAQRMTEIRYAVTALEKNPNVSVYLDATNSAWQPVAAITQRLLKAGVRQAQGFVLNVSNYQPDDASIDYGTWISDCIAITADRSNNGGACASQFSRSAAQWYAQNMGDAVATTHFVIDTSRNGKGPNSMRAYDGAPYNQPASVISTLVSGSWCNPPAAGLGVRPTANTGVPLLDAYLWAKIPGASDGQCGAAGGVRAWDYAGYTQPGWPTDAATREVFDPLWGLLDPVAGAWFPQQAIQLAQEAQPPLN